MKVEVTMEKSTYLLVHGAWGGSWCWSKFTPELEARGIAWRAVDLPSSMPSSDPATDLFDDARVVIEAAAAIEGPVTLVGHSYAGAVISQAAARVPNLHQLVYLAATVPLVGQSHTDSVREVRSRTAMDAAIRVEGPLLLLDRDAAALALYQDCPADVRRWAIEQAGVQTLASFRAVRTAPNTSAPSLYVVCGHDHAIDPTVQKLLSERCDETVRLVSDHCPYLSHPAELAQAILA